MKVKRGLIITNAYSDLPSCLYCADRLKQEFAALGIAADIKRNNFFCAQIAECEKAEITSKTNSTAHIGGVIALNGVENYGFCVYLDKDKYISQMLEKSGLRLFNSHSAIQSCDDKMTTAILLADSGVPLPATLSGLLCYDENAPLNEEIIGEIGAKLGYPVIIKESYGSLGKGVYKADDRAQLLKIAEKLKCRPHLFQRCVKGSLGKDTRVIVIGGKVIAAMRRSSDNDFRSNIERGGLGIAVEITEELAALCVKVAGILKLDYCGIDVLSDETGHYICEVNSNAFFGGIEKATGVNVARAYAEYILKTVY